MMRISYSLFILILFSFPAVHAQQTSFEGIVDYQVEVTSKIKGVSDESMRKMFALGPVQKVYIKKGNYKRDNNKAVEFHLKDSSAPLILFKGIDTIYEAITNNEDSVVVSVKKEDKTMMIAGRPCKSLVIKRAKTISTYFYDASLYQDPAFNSGNNMGDYSVFLKSTSSAYLKVITEFEYATLVETAYRVAPGKVDDVVFTLPQFPRTIFKPESLLQPAEFKSVQDWNNYLQKNMKLELVSKYVKIPKGQQSADQVAEVSFVVLYTGSIGDVTVTNSKEVHPALVKEATRLIKESYGWKPASIHGEKIDSWVTQKITFRSTIE